jgi:polygalacturonase
LIVLLLSLSSLILGESASSSELYTKNGKYRADSCTVTQFSDVENAKKSCKTIVLDNLKVPEGKTLDLLKLKKGATVTFKGTTVSGL